MVVVNACKKRLASVWQIRNRWWHVLCSIDLRALFSLLFRISASRIQKEWMEKRKRKTNNIMIQTMDRPPGLHATKQFTLAYELATAVVDTSPACISIALCFNENSTHHKLQMDIRLPYPPWTITKVKIYSMASVPAQPFRHVYAILCLHLHP